MDLKRIFDVASAGTALVLLAPVLFLVAVLVRFDSPGPALFRHRRVGRYGAPFDVLKFRTMSHRPVGSAAGPEITAGNDARITRVGAVLRHYKLDELPQLLNVVRGEMSIVGPRPEVARYVALYSDADRAIVLSVRPGITDLASLEFRHEQDMLAAAADPEQLYAEVILPRKVELYRQYVATRSFALDLRVIFSTLRAIVS